MNSLARTSQNRRLSAYSALAGAAISAAPSAGAVISQDGLNLVATPGNPVSIDFGPGFGAMFTFGFATFFTNSSLTSYSTERQFITFNPANTGGWTGASVLGYATAAANGNPLLMMTSDTVRPRPGWRLMNGALSHNLARVERYLQITYIESVPYAYRDTDTSGQWPPSKRGFVGLRFTQDGRDHINYAWIDVEADFGAQTITVHGWAYESTPNKILKIPAPAVGGLATLALGAAGIRRTRHKADA